MIRYLSGDATRPATDGPVVIAHVCNDIGAWGAGFVLAVSKRWPEPERAYRALSPADRRLGTVELVPVASPTTASWWVANMVGQHGLRRAGGTSPVRYDAITQALQLVAEHAKTYSASVHMPRIGCGLAGGTWNRIGPIIEQTLVAAGIVCYVYDLL